MSPKSAVAMRPIGNIKLSIQQTLDDKLLAKPLNPVQVKQLLQYMQEVRESVEAAASPRGPAQ